jgi:hypothetical protein
VQEVAAAHKPKSKSNASHFTSAMQTEAQRVVKRADFLGNLLPQHASGSS